MGACLKRMPVQRVRIVQDKKLYALSNKQLKILTMETIHFTGTSDGQVIKNNFQTEIFNEGDVESWYDSNKILNEASKEVAALEDQLKIASENAGVIRKAVSLEFDKWDIDTLSDYISNTHHRNAKRNAIVIYDLIQKMNYKYSEVLPELSKLAAASFLFFQTLLNHLMKILTKSECMIQDILKD